MHALRSVSLGLAFAAFAHAGPAEDAIVAAMRLSEQPSYSWVSTVVDDARTYDITAQTMRGGYTCVKMPVINSVRRRLGRTATDTIANFIFKGNERCVLETEKGWQLVDELPPYVEEGSELERAVAAAASAAPTRSRSVLAPIGGRVTVPVVAGRKRNSHPDDRGYSNLQLAIAHPHEDLSVIVSAHEEWRVEGDVVSGSLTDLGAQLLLVRDGQKDIDPRQARGTFKLWIKDGMVSRFQVKLEGLLVITTRNGRNEVRVNQTATTVVKDIGTTRFEVPPEARLKLERGLAVIGR